MYSRVKSVLAVVILALLGVAAKAGCYGGSRGRGVGCPPPHYGGYGGLLASRKPGTRIVRPLMLNENDV